jgi:ParB family chromosome partitioning protein
MGVRIRHEPGTEGGILSVRYANLDELDLLCQVLAAIPRD